MRLKHVGIFGLISLVSTASLLMMICFPQQSFIAALEGVAIWWNILFPALFPFLVLSELLLGFGIVHFLGTLLDPLMRPLFRVPGIGGFIVAMGFASGYPVAARLTSQLWEQKLLMREEGERLVAFTTTSDPIFLIGAVAVGFFHDAHVATVLAAAHYGSALILGLLMRFHGKKHFTPPAKFKSILHQHGILWRSFAAMHQARLKDGRPLGTLIQQAIFTSIEIVFVIGGLVVFFAVILEFLSISPIMGLLSHSVWFMLHLVHLPGSISPSIVKGFFEVTLGVKSAGQMSESTPLMFKTAAAAFILSWGGLSVHAQVLSILHRTNLRYRIFFFARFVHALLAALAVALLWRLMY